MRKNLIDSLKNFQNVKTTKDPNSIPWTDETQKTKTVYGDLWDATKNKQSSL